MAAAIVIFAPRLGCAQLAGRAIQQPYAQMFFQTRELFTHGGLNGAELARDGGKTAGLYHPDEKPHLILSVHDASTLSLILHKSYSFLISTSLICISLK